MTSDLRKAEGYFQILELLMGFSMVLWLTLAAFALLDIYGDYERARELCGTPLIGPFSSVIICNIGREIFVLAGFIVFLLFCFVSWMDPGWWTRPITKSAVKKEFSGKRPACISDFLMFLMFSSGFWLRSKMLAVLVYIFLFYFFIFSRALATHFRARYDRLKIHYLLMSLYLSISLLLGIGLNVEYISCCPAQDLLALTLIFLYFIVSSLEIKRGRVLWYLDDIFAREELKINLERRVFACNPGEKVRIITKVEGGRFLKERNFKVFVDGNDVKIEKFRASGLSYELEISTPAEVGRHSGIVEVIDGVEHSFDCFEIVIDRKVK